MESESSEHAACMYRKRELFEIFVSPWHDIRVEPKISMSTLVSQFSSTLILV